MAHKWDGAEAGRENGLGSGDTLFIVDETFFEVGIVHAAALRGAPPA